MQRCFKLFKLALTAALLVGILLVTDINRLNVPEQIGKNHLFSILDWELSKLPDKWSYKIKSLLKNDEQTKTKRFVIYIHTIMMAKIMYMEYLLKM